VDTPWWPKRKRETKEHLEMSSGERHEDSRFQVEQSWRKMEVTAPDRTGRSGL